MSCSKLLVLILSSDITYLERAVQSVQRQLPSDFEVELKIIVNSTNSNYVEDVVNNFSEIHIIETVSNGNPGKGHNSCLQFFNANPEFDYLTILDGDDLFYPVAFQRMSEYLKKYTFDILHSMTNDKIIYHDFHSSNYKYIAYNFKLIGSFDFFVNQWKLNKCLPNPFENVYQNTVTTPSRIILTNRKILQSTIKYDEDLSVFDDMIAFFHLYESTINKEITSLAVCDSYIYHYNLLNELNVSSKLKEYKNWKGEMQLLRQKIQLCNFKHVPKWELYKLPFGSIAKPTNFTTEDKLSFCLEKIVKFELDHLHKKISKYIKHKNNTEYKKKVMQSCCII